MTAKVLAVLCSGRKKGYTASILAHAIEGAQEVPGVEIDFVSLFDYEIKPCQSCFSCVKKPENMCIIDDDFGRKGQGELLKKVNEANGILLAEPVHMWSTSTSCHLFLERLYPFLWNGKVNGFPFASISCASNQGFYRFAAREICRRLIPYNIRPVDILGLHTAMPDAYTRARELGKKLAEAARLDAKKGRQAFLNELEKFKFYSNMPENAFLINLENMTNGLNQYEGSLVEMGNSFEHPEGQTFARQASEALKEALAHHLAGDLGKSMEALVKASDYWTNATWKEFLEDNVIGTKMPKSYKFLPNKHDQEK